MSAIPAQESGAAIASAFFPDATVQSVVQAATAHLLPTSAREMRDRIHETLALLDERPDYESFRATYYERHLYPTISDSRETVRATLALFQMANGNPEQAIIYGANLGRDADTIGTMVGGLAGASAGASGLPRRWLEKVAANPNVTCRDLAPRLAGLIRARAQRAQAYAHTIATLA